MCNVTHGHVSYFGTGYLNQNRTRCGGPPPPPSSSASLPRQRPDVHHMITDHLNQSLSYRTSIYFKKLAGSSSASRSFVLRSRDLPPIAPSFLTLIPGNTHSLAIEIFLLLLTPYSRSASAFPDKQTSTTYTSQISEGVDVRELLESFILRWRGKDPHPLVYSIKTC